MKSAPSALLPALLRVGLPRVGLPRVGLARVGFARAGFLRVGRLRVGRLRGGFLRAGVALALAGLLVGGPAGFGPPTAQPLLAQADASTSLGAVPIPNASRAEDPVMEVVNRLFDGMRARDGEMVASVFHPAARLVSTGSEPDGSPRVQVQGVEGFVAAVGQGGVPWNEPLFATEVRMDGNLAHVWTFYRFYAGDRFSHCGYNSIRLVRSREGWLIVDLADTRRTEGCEPPES